MAGRLRGVVFLWGGIGLASFTALGWWAVATSPPRYHELWLYFHLHEDGFDRVAREIERHPRWHHLVLQSEGAVRIEDSDGRALVDGGPESRRVARLLRDAGVDILWRSSDDGLYAPVTTEYAFGHRFDVAFRWKRGAASPHCTDPSFSKAYGLCDKALKRGWVVSYDWMPPIGLGSR